MNPFSLGLIAGLIPSFFIIIHARKKSKERDKALRLKLNKYIGKTTFPIRYASQKRFSKFWKFFPWDSSGVLVVDGNIIRCDLSAPPGGIRSIELELKDISPLWLGRKHWFKNSVASWFVIEDHLEQKHYFTSETGTYIFGSKRTTKEILEELKKANQSSEVFRQP